jgi:hypothetical protein
MTAQSEKKVLENRLGTALKDNEGFRRDNAALRERNAKAMELASKYSPDNYTKLQYA